MENKFYLLGSGAILVVFCLFLVIPNMYFYFNKAVPIPVVFFYNIFVGSLFIVALMIITLFLFLGCGYMRKTLSKFFCGCSKDEVPPATNLPFPRQTSGATRITREYQYNRPSSARHPRVEDDSDTRRIKHASYKIRFYVPYRASAAELSRIAARASKMLCEHANTFFEGKLTLTKVPRPSTRRMLRYTLQCSVAPNLAQIENASSTIEDETANPDV